MKFSDAYRKKSSKGEKGANESIMLSQSDIMKKGYLRLERRNTRFKLETINASDATESLRDLTIVP